jgi:cytidylate kinase
MNIHDVSLTLAEALLRSHSPEESETSPGRGRDIPTPPFTISISREAGAKGTTLAAELGKRLNWPVYDQELINKIAAEIGRPSFHVRGVDEKHFSWLEDTMANLFSDYYVNPNAYLKKLITTIRGLGEVGKCIIVGRGSSFILKPETTLRVRLIADMPDRAKYIAQLRGVSEREAARWVEKTEEDRILFTRKHFDKDVADPHGYDLILNMSRMSVEEATEAIVQMLSTFEARRAVASKHLAGV